MQTNLLLISFYAEKSETVYQTKVMSTDFLEKLYCASPFCPAVPLYFFMEDIIFVRFNIFFYLTLYTKSNKNLHTRKLRHSLFFSKGMQMQFSLVLENLWSSDPLFPRQGWSWMSQPIMWNEQDLERILLAQQGYEESLFRWCRSIQ